MSPGSGLREAKAHLRGVAGFDAVSSPLFGTFDDCFGVSLSVSLSLAIYICIYTYICIYIYVYTYYICVYLHICIYVYVYTFTRLAVDLHAFGV